MAQEPPTAGRARRLLPLVLATTATQAAIVVLAPLLVEIGDSLDASVSAVGVARAVLAGTAFAGSLLIGPLIDRVGVRPLIVRGAALGTIGVAATAAAPTLPAFYAAHVVTGVGVACLLSAGFAGVAAYFGGREMAWAMGYVIGLQSLSWILGNPIVGVLGEVSWRLAYIVPTAVCLAALAAGLAMRPPPPHAGSAATAAVPESIRESLAAVFSDRSARRWALTELVAYSAWTAELTYTAAFYIDRYGTGLPVIGLLLAGGSAVFLAVSLSTARLTTRFARKRMLVGSAIAMAVVLAVIFNWAPSPLVTFGLFCVGAVFAAIRLTGSSALGLDQLPSRPGAMMGARTGAAQLGYLVGAAGGGAVLAVWGFGALGFVLCAGMVASALLLAGVHDPWSRPDAR